MFSKFKMLLSVAALVLSMSAIAFAQETTGTIEGTIKDPQGSAVPGVTVTVRTRGLQETEGARSDATVGFTRTVTTDDSGFFRVLQIPPGWYAITTSATAGFGETTVNNIEVVLGRTTPVNIDLKAGGVAEVVNVTSDQVAIDPTENAIQTNITARTAELLPKGVNFTSLLNTAPAVRNEPLSGGFQIDGASGSENTFIIDGQEVTNFRTGVLNLNNNIPFQFVQEVQVKSSGFDAEFGGATGGVVTVVTRGGSNEFHGELGNEFRVSQFQGDPRRFLRLISNTAGSEYLTPKKDEGTDLFPFASLGGPIIKDRAWFFGSYAPQLIHTRRTIEYISHEPGGPRHHCRADLHPEAEERVRVRQNRPSAVQHSSPVRHVPVEPD